MLYNFIGLNMILGICNLYVVTSLVSTGNDKNASPLHVFLTVNSLQLISLPCFVGESS